jgi:hypothetical protein
VWSQKAQRGAQKNKIQAEEALHKLHFLAGCSLLSLALRRALWFHCEILRQPVEVRVCFQWQREGSIRRERLRKSGLWDLSAGIRPFEDERVSQYPDAGILNELIRLSPLGVNMTRRAHCLFTCLRPFAPPSITERALLLQIQRKLCAQCEQLDQILKLK